MESARKGWIAKSKDYSEVKEDLERRKLKFKDYLISVEEMNEDDLECITRICHIEKADGKEYYKCSIACYYLSDYKNATIEELEGDLAEAEEELEELEEELEEMPEKVNLPQVRIWGGTEEYLSSLCQTEGRGMQLD